MNGELTIGKEYRDVEMDFLTKLPWKETRITYMGRSPYDGRHIFASETGGTLLVPDNGKLFDRMQER
jgi:hypothetical protein